MFDFGIIGVCIYEITFSRCCKSDKKPREVANPEVAVADYYDVLKQYRL